MTASLNAADERGLTPWAERAEQAVRVLLYRTRPVPGELTHPAEAAEVIAVLTALTHQQAAHLTATDDNGGER